MDRSAARRSGGSLSALTRLDRWLATQYAISDESIAVYRIGCALALLYHSRIPFWVARVPDSLFLPHIGPFQLLESVPAASILHGLRWGMLGSALLLAAGVGVAPAAIALGALVILQQGLSYSVENVHHHILLALAPILLSQSGWDRRWSLLPKRLRCTTSGEPATAVGLALLALAIGFVFFTAALPKIIGGWLDLSTTAAHAHVLSRGRAGQNVGKLLDFAFATSDSPVWELLDWLTIAIEGAVLLVVPWRRAFLFVLACLVFLHLGIYLFMGTNFSDYVIAYAAFVDWRKGWNTVASRLHLEVPPAVGAVVLLLWAAGLYLSRSPRVGILASAAVISAVYVTTEAFRFFHWVGHRRTAGASGAA